MDEQSGTEAQGQAGTRAEPPDHVASARALLLVSISGGLFAFWLGWDFGAFEIFVGYKRYFAFVIISLVALAVSFVHPHALRVSMKVRFMLSLPLLAMVLIVVLPDNLLILLALVPAAGAVLTLPVTLMALARMLDTDFLRLGRRDQWVAVALIGTCLALGVVGGHYHPRLVTCQEFAHYGDWVPPNCLDELEDILS